METEGIDQQWLVITWRKNRESDAWRVSRATVCNSISVAKRLRTVNKRYWNLKTSIIAASLLDGIGEVSEPMSRVDFRRKVLSENLEKLNAKGGIC